MKKLATFTAAALAAFAFASTAFGDWVYEGKWGSSGMGDGQFDMPMDVAVGPTGNVYVADTYNNRIQYFNRNEPAVSPASLGRVKALFR